jgi:hypothetical protein
MSPQVKHEFGQRRQAARQLGHSPIAQKNSSSIQNFFSPERVMRSFNTRAFKREHPDNPELMLQIVAKAVARKEPIPFVLYWGKGPRSFISTPEIKCLDFLNTLTSRVRECFAPGARLSLIFTDTHAALNGHKPAAIEAYFEELTAAANRHCFQVHLLSRLIHEIDPDLDSTGVQERIPPNISSTLCASASKWFRGEGTVEQGATRYYQLNMVEKRIVERAFASSIFITFNGSELRCLFPDHLPIFYMYSLRHGVCDKPWFLPNEPVGLDPPKSQRLALIHSN